MKHPRGEQGLAKHLSNLLFFSVGKGESMKIWRWCEGAPGILFYWLSAASFKKVDCFLLFFIILNKSKHRIHAYRKYRYFGKNAVWRIWVGHFTLCTAKLLMFSGKPSKFMVPEDIYICSLKVQITAVLRIFSWGLFYSSLCRWYLINWFLFLCFITELLIVKNTSCLWNTWFYKQWVSKCEYLTRQTLHFQGAVMINSLLKASS